MVMIYQKKPGLSAYANDPEAAANSLQELLQKAEAVVPPELRQKTPVRVGVRVSPFPIVDCT